MIGQQNTMTPQTSLPMPPMSISRINVLQISQANIPLAKKSVIQYNNFVALHKVMENKARDNINAAQLLITNEFYDSSASRAYYATYLAASHNLSKIGIQPQHKAKKGGSYWPHDRFPWILCDEYKIIGPIQMEKFELLYSRRIKADYYAENVEKEEADDSIRIAFSFVSLFLDKKGIVE